MNLTLTGGSTLSDRTATATSAPPLRASHAAATHGARGDGGGPQGGGGASSLGPPSHDHGHGQNPCEKPCCHAPSPASRPAPNVDASALLPTEEAVRRFRTDKLFRLAVLSNVVRGGSYELFLNVLTILVAGEEEDRSFSAEGCLGGAVATDATREEGGSRRSDEAVVQGTAPEALAPLLDGHGADGHTLAHWCAKRGDEPRFLSFLVDKSHAPHGLRLLLNLHAPSKDAVGMYPLHWAVTEGAVPLVGMLLRHLEARPDPIAAAIDARDAAGCTPLLVAAQYGHPDLAAFLLRRGADPRAVDASGDTALHWAAYKGSLAVCGMLLHLLGMEGQLDAVDKFGQAPLHLASLRGNAETVQFLVEEAESAGEARGGGGGPKRASFGMVTGVVVGSKEHRATSLDPGRLLTMRDKEEKTPRDLAVKKKKLACELLLKRYEEQYVFRKRSLLSRLSQTCRDLCSLHSWKVWMGVTGTDLPVGQSPTFPFYWMTSHILLGGIVYANQFVGIGGTGRVVGDDTLLWDKAGLHLFFVGAWFATWANLYYVYNTNPGVLDATRRDATSSYPAATCQLLCCNRRGGAAGYPKDKVGQEMDAVTKELRRQYDEVLESFSRDFPSSEQRVPLCHTCRIVKPLRSKHCRVARRCVLVFDHHCPFVGTTVGLYNYIYFYLFLLSYCLMEGGFIAAWILFMTRSKKFPKGAFLMGGYFVLYLVPVAIMAFYHTTLLVKNMSTNEQINAQKYRYFWDENGRFLNPFDQGKIQNVLQKCWPDRGSYELGGRDQLPCGEVELIDKDKDERKPLV